MVRKLELFGHVVGFPERRISSYHSWPKGVAVVDMIEVARRFARAFVFVGRRWVLNDGTSSTYYQTTFVPEELERD